MSVTASCSCPGGWPNGAITSGARIMKQRRQAPRPSSIRKKTLEATRQARLRSPFSSSSVKTGTNADESAASATSARIRFGTWKATVKALILPGRAEVVGGDDLADEAEDARDAGRGAEDRRRADAGASGGEPRVLAALGTPPRDARDVTTDGSPRKSIGGGPVCYDRLCPRRWRAFSRRTLYRMPNIRQQKKRVRSAARQRLENLRYRSTVKTLTRRLRDAVDEGDTEKIAAEHAELVRCIDKAATRGALHRNTAARKKAQAARLVSGPVRLATAARERARAPVPRGRVISTSARSSSRSSGSLDPPLTASVESRRGASRPRPARRR